MTVDVHRPPQQKEDIMSTVIVSVPSWRDRMRHSILMGMALIGEMPFLDHLEELRQRLIKSLIALAAGSLIGFVYTAPIIAFLEAPALGSGITLVAIDATEVFAVYFKVALAAGICLAAPIILWQVWRFIEPALYKHEKRFAAPFIISTTLCFIAGAVFGYRIVTPWLLKLELAMAKEAGLVIQMSADSYLAMFTATVVSMGVIFEMPPIIFILSRIGLVSAKFLIRNFKYAFLLFTIAAAVLTPSTQPPPMLFFMAVMTGLYLLSVLVAMVFGRTRKTDTGI
jgi:sec-independent protein translocase protein TatC